MAGGEEVSICKNLRVFLFILFVNACFSMFFLPKIVHSRLSGLSLPNFSGPEVTSEKLSSFGPNSPVSFHMVILTPRPDPPLDLEAFPRMKPQWPLTIYRDPLKKEKCSPISWPKSFMGMLWKKYVGIQILASFLIFLMIFELSKSQPWDAQSPIWWIHSWVQSSPPPARLLMTSKNRNVRVEGFYGGNRLGDGM